MSLADFNYCQGFGPDAPPYHPQRTTDWDLASYINPIQVSSSPFETRQSPPFAGPSQTSASSQSDSEASFRLSPFSPAALLSPSPPATRRPIEEKRAKVITESAASPPIVRDAVFHIVHSPEWEAQQEVHGDLLMPIVEAVFFPNGGRSGSRGGIDRYRCLFGACGKVIKRRDHMLNHVRCHLGLKPWVCGFASVDKQWSVFFSKKFALYLLTQPFLVALASCGLTISNATCATSTKSIWTRTGRPPSSIYLSVLLTYYSVLAPISPSPTVSSRSAVPERPVDPNPTRPTTPPTTSTNL